MFLAVTIGVGPVWRLMAELVSESVRRRTGLETRILGEEAMAQCRVSSPHFLKLRLFELLPEAEHILYFDADTIFLQQWDPRIFAGRGEFICVLDRAEDEAIRREAHMVDLPADMYFHAGLFIANAAFNTLGRAPTSMVLNWARATLGTIPFVLAGAWMGGASGVLAGHMLGGIPFGILAVFLCYRLMDELAAAKARAQPATPEPATN